MTIGVLIGSLAVLSNNSWPLIWLGFEMNLMSFVPSVMKEDKKPAMMYFIIQSVGSIMILSSAMLSEYQLSFVTLILLGIMMKLGAAPLHFWLPNVLTALNTMGLYIIMSWQKMAPIFIFSLILLFKDNISLINLWAGVIMMMAMASPIMVMIFSGVSQMGWMFMIQGKLLAFFMFIYFSILMPIIWFLKTSTKNFFWGMMNAGGLPPFSGFMIKLKAITYMKKKMAMMFLSASITALACYSRMMLNSRYKTDKVSLLTIYSLMVGMV